MYNEACEYVTLLTSSCFHMHICDTDCMSVIRLSANKNSFKHSVFYFTVSCINLCNILGYHQLIITINSGSTIRFALAA